MSDDRHPRVFLLALATVVGSLTSGCHGRTGTSEETTTSHALQAVGSTHDLCIGTKTNGRRLTEGFDTVVNSGSGRVHVDRVQWLHNHGLAVHSVSLIRRTDRDGFPTFGILRGSPPKHLARDGGPSMPAAWKRRVPAQGANLDVTDDPDQHYYILIISFSGAHGSAGPLRLSYTDSHGNKGAVDTFVTVKTRPHCE